MRSTEQENPEPEETEMDAPDSKADEVEAEAADDAEAEVVEETTTSESAIDDASVDEIDEAPEKELEVVESEASKPAGEHKVLNIFKRILLYVAIVIGAVFFLLGLAGVIGVWVINTPATETILAILEPIDNSLQRLEGVAGEVGVALSEVSTSLDEADQQVQELGAGLAETNLVVEAINRIFDADVEQSLAKAGDNVVSIYDTVVAIEETINAINGIPLLKIEVPGSDEIASIRTGMEELAASADELQQESQQRREDRADSFVEAVSAPINRLNDRVDDMYTRITGAEDRLGLAVENIDEIQSKVPGWIDIASIIATLLLAWLMFSQAAVIILCWRALHPKAVPAVA
jgi:hypothetical protein